MYDDYEHHEPSQEEIDAAADRLQAHLDSPAHAEFEQRMAAVNRRLIKSAATFDQLTAQARDEGKEIPPDVQAIIDQLP